jgi:hypothetical protein
MRPWESLSRRDGGQPAQRGGLSRRSRAAAVPTANGWASEAERAGAGARAKGQAKLDTRRVRLRQRELEKPAILRVSGLFGFVAASDLGFVRAWRRSGSIGFPRRP